MHLVTVSTAMTLSRLYETVTTDVLGRHRQRSRKRTKGSNAGHADHDMFAGGGSGGRRKSDSRGAHGKGEGRGNGKGGFRGQLGRGGISANKDGGGSAIAAGSNGSSVKADVTLRWYLRGETPQVWRKTTMQELCNRCRERGYAGDVCPLQKNKAVLAAFDDDDDDNKVGVEDPAFRAGEAGACSDNLGRKGEGESAWHVWHEAWLGDSGASTQRAP